MRHDRTLGHAIAPWLLLMLLSGAVAAAEQASTDAPSTDARQSTGSDEASATGKASATGQASATGRGSGTSQTPPTEQAAAMDGWSYEGLQQGVGVRMLIDQVQATDTAGEDAGTVRDFIVVDGKIESIVIEQTGFLGLTDQHYACSMRWVRLQDDGTVRLELEADAVEDRCSEVAAEPEAGTAGWRITQLLQDEARVADGRAYGRVTDVMVSPEGELLAVVVHPNATYGVQGPFAWPFHGTAEGFEPSQAHYQIPYGLEAVSQLDLFQYEPMEMMRPR